MINWVWSAGKWRTQTERVKRSAGHDKAVGFFHFLEYRPDFVNPRLVTEREAATSRRRMSTSLRIAFEEYESDYRVETVPVSFTYRGNKMVFLTFRLKE